MLHIPHIILLVAYLGIISSYVLRCATNLERTLVTLICLTLHKMCSNSMYARAFIGLSVFTFKHLCLYPVSQKATYSFKGNSIDQ